VPADGMQQRELYEEPFVVAAPESHELARRKSVKTSDLDGQTVLLLEDGHCLRDQALAVCARTDAREKQDFRATSLETLRQMVASGAGITLLPQLASSGAYGSARGVTIVPFARPAPMRRIGALWRRTSARSIAINAVCDVIAEAAPKFLDLA
jgi:LysR family transcriptional regulator, hydrogen peroxide-inducible genes activator